MVMLGAMVVGGLAALLWRATTVGDLYVPPLQAIVGVAVGLFAGFVMLVMLSDAIPDQIEWVGTALLTSAIILVVAVLWVRTRR